VKRIEKLTKWYTDFLGKPVVAQLVKTFLAFCGTIRFITVLIRARHLT
jgi:hypothetical protein